MQGQEKQSISKVKQKWFDFTMQLVSNDVHLHLQKLSMNVYIFFIMIESLQFIGYHNNGLINYRAFGFDYLGNLLKYLNFLPLMINQNINLFLVPFFTVLIIIHITLIAVGFHTYHKKMEKLSKSVDDRDFRKSKLEYFINLLMVSFSTFLTIPICQTSVLSIYCQREAPFTKIQNCYSSTQICIAILAVINIIWLIVINLYFSLYYYNRNPFSTNFLTCSSNWWSLGKFAIKIIPIFYLSYDPYLAYPVLFLIMINGCYAGYIIMFRILFPFYRYNFHLQKTVFFIQFMTLFTNIGFAVIYSFNTVFSQKGKYGNNVFFVLWIVASLMLSKLALDFFVRIKEKLIIDVHSVEKLKQQNVLEYLIYLIFQAEKNINDNKGGLFVGSIAKAHRDICEKADCYCKIYFQRVTDKGYDKDKQIFYTLILAIIDRVMQQNRRVTSFFILKAYILYYKMQSQIKAATTIATIMMDKLDFSDQMLVKGLLLQLNNQYNDTRDMQIYRKFNQYLLQQEEESMKLANFYIQYWEELIDQSSSIPKLHKILNLIKYSKQKLNNIVLNSLVIYRNHVRVLLIYKNFLKQVLNDYVGYLRYEQKYKVGLKEHKLTNVDAVNTIQFRPNQNLVVINFTRRFSTHTQIMGNFQILNISSNVKDVLGFTNVELKDQSLNKMIPRIYHAIHDTFIDQILDKKDAEIVSYQYRIFPLNSEGHIVQCNIISKFMPSVTCGINIVSFIQQCDKYKDEFFIIYDKNDGIVDAMNETAEKMLKDVSRRKSNDMLSIPDHINDLIPNWDYKNQVWKERIGRGKSMKSISSGSQIKYELKSIQIVRSDGLQMKNIKILKFKGDFFMKMFSFDNNYESYKQSNTIQQYLQYQKNSNSFSKMDSNQLQDLISANDTHHLIERGRQMKKTMKKLEKKQKEKTRHLTIQSSPPNISKIIFIVVQLFFCCLAVGITIYETVITNKNINSYIRDSQLLIDVNSIQFLISDSTFILSLITTEMAYNTNMYLPYSNFKSSIQLKQELKQMRDKLDNLKRLARIIDPIFVQKINSKQISYSSLSIQVKYLLAGKDKDFYFQQTDIIQAVYQYISYATDFDYRIITLQTPIQDLLQLPNYFFIFVNNINILPQKILLIKDIIINSINSQLDKGFNLFLVIKLINSILILLSVIGVIIYYKFIFKNYIMQVLKMYECIKIDQIKLYQQKCNKYKNSLTYKADNVQSTSKISEQQQSNAFIQIVPDQNAELSPIGQVKNQNEEEEQQQNKLIGKQKNTGNEQLISFESKPKIWKRVIIYLAWIAFYGIIQFAICFSYSKGTILLENHIKMLNNYAILQNSVVQMRFFSHLSLNMVGYWDQNYLNSINKQLEQYFSTAINYIDDPSLNFTHIKPEFARKYQEMRYIQSLVVAKNKQMLNILASQIQVQLEDMDSLIRFVSGQSNFYGPIVESDASQIGATMNVCMGLEFIFIFLYWYFGVRKIYYKLLKEHENTYQMYSIISYNLRKQIQKTE